MLFCDYPEMWAMDALCIICHVALDWVPVAVLTLMFDHVDLYVWVIRSGLSKKDLLVLCFRYLPCFHLDSRDTLILMLCYFGWPKGQMLYFDSSIIDVRLYAVEFVHICMMMHLDVTGCVMMLNGYFWFQVYTWFSIIEALLLCCSVYHIACWCYFEMTRSMTIPDYRVYWTHLWMMIWDEFYAMAIYFILVSLHFLWMWVM